MSPSHEASGAHCDNCGAHIICGPDCPGADVGYCRLETSESCPVEICSKCAGQYEEDERPLFVCKPCHAEAKS